MAAMSGQPGTKPQNVGAPVPTAKSKKTAADLLAEFDAPQMEQPSGGTPQSSVPMPQSADSLLNQIDQSQQLTSPAEDQFAPEPGFIQANIEQFGKLGDRVRAGLAANDKQKLAFLQQRYGPQNAVMKSGNIWYRRSSEEKLKRFDPDPESFELIADFLDFGREAVTEGAMLPGEVMGGMLGTAAGGPGLGTAGGAVMGRVASVPMANNFADGVAQAAGIPQDPQRDLRMENNIGMATEAVLPVAGKYALKPLVKKIPGTAAYREARDAGSREVVALTKQSQELVEATKRLEQEGIDAPLMLHQANPDDPHILQTLERVRAEPKFIEKQNEIAQGADDAIKNTLREIGRRANPNGKIDGGNLAKNISNIVKTLDRAEGQAIGNYQAKAMARLGNKPQQIPQEITENALEMMQKLGFTIKDRTVKTQSRAGEIRGVENFLRQGEKQVRDYIPPIDMKRLAGTYGISDDGQLRSVVNILNEYGQLISKGNEARLPDIERMITKMGDMNQNLKGTKLGGQWGKMTGDLRQFKRDVVTSGLEDPVEKKLYNAVMDDFSLIRKNSDDIAKVLDSDMTRKGVVNYFFSPSAGKERIQALQAIVGKDSPQWGSLKEEFIDSLIMKHSKGGSERVNPDAFLKTLRVNYGDDFISSVLNDGKHGPNYQTVKDTLIYAKRINETLKSVKTSDDMSEKVKESLTSAFIGMIANLRGRTANSAMSLVDALRGNKNDLMEIFNREGYEKYLAKYKGKDKAEIALKIEDAMQAYNAAVAHSKNVGVVPRALRATTREGMER